MSLSTVYLETLLLLRKCDGRINGANLARLADCKPTAMNNRLVQLERYGLVKGERSGRQVFWKAL